MRIDVIMLISGLSPEALENRRAFLQSYASEGTEVRLVETRNAPPSVDSLPEMELAAPGILERALMSQEEGADAVVIWGGHDPSLESSRNLVEIPVMAPGMASMYLASMLADTFALIIQLPHVTKVAERQIADLGLVDKCNGIYSVDLPVLELREPEGFQRVLETAIQAVEDGADSICFGCMALNDHTDRLQEELDTHFTGVKVIHPGKAVIRLTELIVELGYTHSKLSYPNPPKTIRFPK
jgi:allantoin racemase